MVQPREASGTQIIKENDDWMILFVNKSKASSPQMARIRARERACYEWGEENANDTYAVCENPGAGAGKYYRIAVLR